MKFKRSERLIDMTYLLTRQPYEKISYSAFTDRYKAAKSSISEDVAILKETIEEAGHGCIETITGASGGVLYLPTISKDKQLDYIQEIIDDIENINRILPGGYLYLTDILSKPDYLKKMAKIVVSQIQDQSVDYVLTVATKGIPLAQAIGYELNRPIIIARKDSKVTEGATISVKYTSESAPHLVQRMEVGRDSIEDGSQVVLVDDFLRGGGTMDGMNAIIDIFHSEVVGKFVLCENLKNEQPQSQDVQSLITVSGLDQCKDDFCVQKGSIFKNHEQS